MDSRRAPSLFQRLSPIQRSLFSAAAGFVFYGGWGYWINYSYGQMVAIKTACVQGGYSFLLTLCMTMLLEGIFRFNSKVLSATNLINWSTIVICCAIVFSGSWAINVAAGTPEVFRTVILGYIFGGFYSISYVFGLARAQSS
jgi:hypothetical protein